MLARVIEVGIRPEKKQEIVTLVQNELIPLLQEQAAFVGHEVVVRDDNPKVALATTYWTNKREAEACYATPEYAAVINQLKPLLTTDLKPVYYTVEISTSHWISFGKAA